MVTNNDNIIFDNLEIQNHRTISRSGVGDLVSFGVLIEVNQSNNNLNNFCSKYDFKIYMDFTGLILQIKVHLMLLRFLYYF